MGSGAENGLSLYERALRKGTRPLRALRRRFLRPGGVILTYHRVTEARPDPYGITVSPANFRDHLRYLSRTCRLMPLGELADRVRSGTLPRRAAAVTLDDGYVDNLTHAKPILEEVGVPATVFVTTGYIDPDREFWWDELVRLFLTNGKQRSFLELRIDDRQCRWNLGDDTDRTAVFWELHGLLKGLRPSETDAAMNDLRAWAGQRKTVRSDCRPMTTGELRELSSDGLVDLGGHTVTHPSLAVLSPEEQADEIRTARKTLMALTGKPVRAHAHPFGGYTADTAAIAEEVGFEIACGGPSKSIEYGMDPLELPRYTIGDWSLETFRQLLERFLVD